MLKQYPPPLLWDMLQEDVSVAMAAQPMEEGEDRLSKLLLAPSMRKKVDPSSSPSPSSSSSPSPSPPPPASSSSTSSSSSFFFFLHALGYILQPIVVPMHKQHSLPYAKNPTPGCASHRDCLCTSHCTSINCINPFVLFKNAAHFWFHTAKKCLTKRRGGGA